MEVAQVVRDRCQCDFPGSFISQAVLLCDQQQPTQIVYRANIACYGSYSADQLVGYIEDWVNEGATLATEDFVVTFDSDCPVLIGSVDDPVCSLPSSGSSAPASVMSVPNTLAVIATSISVIVIITK